jgi:acetyltransferase
VDIIGDAGPELYAKAVEIAVKDPNTDGLLVILTPQAMTDATATAEQLTPFAQLDGKPILASWMGAGQVEVGEEILNAARIPTFKYPIARPAPSITCGVTARICALSTKPRAHARSPTTRN